MPVCIYVCVCVCVCVLYHLRDKQNPFCSPKRTRAQTHLYQCMYAHTHEITCVTHNVHLAPTHSSDAYTHRNTPSASRVKSGDTSMKSVITPAPICAGPITLTPLFVGADGGSPGRMRTVTWGVDWENSESMFLLLFGAFCNCFMFVHACELFLCNVLSRDVPVHVYAYCVCECVVYAYVYCLGCWHSGISSATCKIIEASFQRFSCSKLVEMTVETVETSLNYFASRSNLDRTVD
jgi:hypothetical protein